MEEDVASFENLLDKKGVFQDVQLTGEEPDEVSVQPKKQRQPQQWAKVTNRMTLQGMEKKLHLLEDFMFEVSVKLPPR